MLPIKVFMIRPQGGQATQAWGTRAIKISKTILTSIKLISPIMKYLFPDYVSLLDITLHIASTLSITSNLFSNSKIKQNTMATKISKIIFMSTILILSIMKLFFPHYASLLNITLHIASALSITSNLFSNNKIKQITMAIKMSKTIFMYIKLILSIIKHLFPDYVSLLNTTSHIASALLITSKFFSNSKTKKVCKFRGLLNIIILGTAMNNSFLYHACGLHHYKCLQEEYKGCTIVLHFESKRVPKGLDRTQVVLKFTGQQYLPIQASPSPFGKQKEMERERRAGDRLYWKMKTTG